jgi:hypothetical protein
MGFFSGIFDPGKKDRIRAATSAQRAVPTSGNIGGPMGINAGFNVDPKTGAINMTNSAGQFGEAGSMLLQMMPQLFGGTGAAGGLAELADSIRPGLDATGLEQREGFSEIFQNALGTLNQDPFELGSQVTAKLQPGLDRAQGNLRNNTFDELFGSGGSSISGAANPVLENLSNVFADQQSQLGVMGFDIGRGLHSDALQQAFTSNQGIAGIDASNVDRLMKQFGMGESIANTAIQDFGVGAQAGLGAGQLAGDFSQLGIPFIQAMMQMQGLTSEAQLGVAGVHTDNAKMAKSPFLEAMKFARSFVNPTGGFSFGTGS